MACVSLLPCNSYSITPDVTSLRYLVFGTGSRFTRFSEFIPARICQKILATIGISLITLLGSTATSLLLLLPRCCAALVLFACFVRRLVRFVQGEPSEAGFGVGRGGRRGRGHGQHRPEQKTQVSRGGKL